MASPPLPPPVTEDELVKTRVVVVISPFEAGRAARVLLREAATRRRKATPGFVPAAGRHDRNVVTAEICENLADHLLSICTAERAAWARREGAG